MPRRPGTENLAKPGPEQKALDRRWSAAMKRQFASELKIAQREAAGSADLAALLGVRPAAARKIADGHSEEMRRWAAARPRPARGIRRHNPVRGIPFDAGRYIFRTRGAGVVFEHHSDREYGHIGGYTFAPYGGSAWLSTAVGYGIVAGSTGLLRARADVAIAYRATTLALIAGYGALRAELGLIIEDTAADGYGFGGNEILNERGALHRTWHEAGWGRGADETKHVEATYDVIRDRKYIIWVQLYVSALAIGAAVAANNVQGWARSVDTEIR